MRNEWKEAGPGRHTLTVDELPVAVITGGPGAYYLEGTERGWPTLGLARHAAEMDYILSRVSAPRTLRDHVLLHARVDTLRLGILRGDLTHAAAVVPHLDALSATQRTEAEQLILAFRHVERTAEDVAAPAHLRGAAADAMAAPRVLRVLADAADECGSGELAIACHHLLTRCGL